MVYIVGGIVAIALIYVLLSHAMSFERRYWKWYEPEMAAREAHYDLHCKTIRYLMGTYSDAKSIRRSVPDQFMTKTASAIDDGLAWMRRRAMLTHDIKLEPTGQWYRTIAPAIFEQARRGSNPQLREIGEALEQIDKPQSPRPDEIPDAVRIWSSRWCTFFSNAIESIKDELSVVLHAANCREGWLQGELYRAGRDRGVRVNEFNLGGATKADVSADGDPPMVAEIKIVGADYQPKMRHFIEADVERLRNVEDPTIERYMILIIPHSEATGVLAEYLNGCSFSDECFERGFDSFRLRIWKVGN